MLFTAAASPHALVITMLVLCVVSQAVATDRTRTITSPIPTLRHTFEITKEGGLTQFWENHHCPEIEDLVLAAGELQADVIVESPELLGAGMAERYSTSKGYKDAIRGLWKDYDEVIGFVSSNTCRESSNTPVAEGVVLRVLQALAHVVHGSITLIVPRAYEDELESCEGQTTGELSSLFLQEIVKEVTKLAAGGRNGVTAVYKMTVEPSADDPCRYFTMQVWPAYTRSSRPYPWLV